MIPERISLMASFLRDKEPLMYLFLLNANYEKIESANFIAGVSLKRGITFHYTDRLLKLPVEAFYFVLVHEAQHTFKQHLNVFSTFFSETAKKEEHLLMNIATDAIINEEILNTPFKYMEELTTNKIFLKDSIQVEKEYKWLLDRQRIPLEDGLTSIRYYNWLKENNYSASQNDSASESGFSNIDLTKDGSLRARYKYFEDLNNLPSSNGQREEENNIDTEEVRGMLSRLVKQAEKMEDELSSAGKEVGNMSRKISFKKEALVDWKKELRKRIRYFVSKNISLPSKKKSYLTYLMNPKSGKDLIFPHFLKQRAKIETNVIVALDTSGSCFLSASEMETFFTEIDSIANSLKKSKQGKVHLIQWDYEVQGEITEYLPNDYKKIELKGGGGTNPSSIFEFLNRNSTVDESGAITIKNGSLDIVASNPKHLPLVIVLTDGDFFGKFRKDGVYEESNNVMFFTRHTRYIPEHLTSIIYK